MLTTGSARTRSCGCRKRNSRITGPARNADYYAQYYRINHDRYTTINLAKYGLTLDDYNTMQEDQGGVCAICSEAETAKSPRGHTRLLTVDHCHKTGGCCVVPVIKCSDLPRMILGGCGEQRTI